MTDMASKKAQMTRKRRWIDECPPVGEVGHGAFAPVARCDLRCATTDTETRP